MEIPTGYFRMGKVEQEAIIFAQMVAAQSVDLTKSKFDLAIDLGVPQSKVDSLVFRYRLSFGADYSNKKALLERLNIVSHDARSKKVTLSLEDKFLREYFMSTLKKQGLYADTSFNRELITISYEKFDVVLDCLTRIGAENIRERLKSKHNGDIGALIAKHIVSGTPSVYRFVQGSFPEWHLPPIF